MKEPFNVRQVEQRRKIIRKCDDKHHLQIHPVVLQLRSWHPQ